MQPYEFGYRVGLATEKRAQNAIGDAVLGTGSAMSQANPFGDPEQRGLIAETALYSNPFTGVPTAVNDVGRHLYNGRYMSALTSGIGGALSFIPFAGGGFGFAAKGMGRAIGAGGKALARQGLVSQATGKAIGRGARQFVNAGADAATNANRAISGRLQQHLPMAKNPGLMGKAWNWGMKNPLQATPMVAPLAGAAGTLGMSAMGIGGGNQQQQFQPSGPGIYGGGQANTPLASF